MQNLEFVATCPIQTNMLPRSKRQRRVYAIARRADQVISDLKQQTTTQTTDSRGRRIIGPYYTARFTARVVKRIPKGATVLTVEHVLALKWVPGDWLQISVASAARESAEEPMAAATA